MNEELLEEKEELKDIQNEEIENNVDLDNEIENQSDEVDNENDLEESEPKKKRKYTKRKEEKIKKALDNDGIVISTRITGKDKLIQYFNWKQEIEKSGSTVYLEMKEVIHKLIDDNDKKVALRKTKDDLFYSLRKAIFASMSPFKQDIDQNINNIRINQNIINKKLDILINVIFERFDRTDEIDNLSSEVLKESNYFKDFRTLINQENDVILKKIEKLNKKYNETFENYIEGEFEKNEKI
ncbi:Mbov_0398 family ICE element protein [Mycoplasma sp. CSL7503-lung]|uniref:Mbov_0398 family ICE element protein n=1 Tax=Mycoplasma sp. CSL7503-lung TaxID=536372 RepID=UPI0021D302BB|nr:hypothetical protein [Mycoplasma sp. CSL7503-lung]MCU4706432.1 hypothetical protein [Mycoplasma sp. CSL7503-lung]